MEIDIQTLLKGKSTIIKNKEYFSTEAYVTPFLERMSKYTNDFRVQVKLPTQYTLTKNGDINMEDITYNRVNIEAILPDDYAFEGHKRTVGFVYALDTRKPIVKQYIGTIRCACLNLCVFNPDALQVQELEPEAPINYSFLTTCMSISDNTNEILKRISEIEYTKEKCYNSIGKWTENILNGEPFNNGFGKVNITETLPIEAYKNLYYNEKSDYYHNENDIITGFDVYNSFTDLVCNGRRPDIVNRFEKTYLISKILGL